MRSVHFPLLLWVLLLVPVNAQSDVDILSAWQGIVRDIQDQYASVIAILPIPADYFSTWNASDPNPCAWFGVTCTANFTVEELDLSGWELPTWGPLEMLAGLKDLRHLDLSSSKLAPNIAMSFSSGSIAYDSMSNAFPEEVSLLNGLTYLDLSGSGMQGTISANISNCTRLRYLSLEQNQLSGEIPSLHGLVNLQVLLFGGNNLTGPFPTGLSGIDTLLRIDLSDNELGGSIPSISSFPNLVDLNLDNNNFTEFAGLQSSTTNGPQRLFASGNQLRGMIPTHITNLQNLQVLNMSRNQLSGIPSGFSRLWNSNLTIVDLSQNNLSGNVPSDFLIPQLPPQLPHYSYINLSHNLLSGDIKLNVTLFGLGSIVDLSCNQFSGPLPSILKGNPNLNQGISFLWLDNNQFSGDVVDILIQAASQPFSFGAQLYLSNNRLTGDLSRMVGNWGNLSFQAIDVSNNYLQMSTTVAIPDPLGATLQAFANDFETYIGSPTGIDLHLAGNNFSGSSLPTRCFGQSSGGSYFEALDLSNNSLTGEILGEVFNATCLQQLKFLNLSNNQLTGPVPHSIVILPNLMVLDVSSNNLSGPLPVIQTSSPFYDPRIFANNPGLCGGPLPPCPSNNPHPTGVPWWVVLVITLVSMMSVVATCLVSTWRWRVYQQRHQQDADLIKTLMERESASLMSLRELKRATDNFAESAQVGEGGFGTVYIGKLSDGTTVAIKRSKHEGSEKDKEQFLNEVRILSQVNHRYLVKLLGCCMENKIALLVFEFVSNGTLQDHLHGKIGAAHLSWKQRLNIGVQAADALSYLHSATTFCIYHRDVKSANILLDNDFNAKVADFGISKLAPVQATHVSTVAVQGTMGYIDPEYYTSFQLTDKSDVYSFGVVLLELISAKPAIDFLRGEDETSLVNFARPHIERGDLEPFIDPVLMETYLDLGCWGRDSILNVGRLAIKCLDMRSKCRPSMNDVWRGLQNLCLEFNGASENSDSINDYHSEAPAHDHGSLLAESFYSDSTSFSIQKDTSSIEMSQCPL